MIIVIRVCLAQCGHLVRAVIRIKTVSLASPGSSTLTLLEKQDSADQNSICLLFVTSDRHFASASDLLALTVALARILALKR